MIKALWNISGINKDGQQVDYSKGDTVEGLTAAEEKRLIEIGAAEKIKKSAAGSNE